jgi:hypothetical protein
MIDASVTVALERDLAPHCTSAAAASSQNDAPAAVVAVDGTHSGGTHFSCNHDALKGLTPLEVAHARCAGTMFSAVYAENWSANTPSGMKVY